MKPFESVYPSSGFISIVVPTFCRPPYLKRLLDTLEEHADVPYEVIVHDDGSVKKYRDEVYDMCDRISTVIFNTGINMGLCEAANRCVSIASSKYVLFLNDDCFFVKPCLKDICKTLSKGYVGTLSPAQDFVDYGSVSLDDTETFCLSSQLGVGSTIAFRKEVWEEVGGWDVRATSAQSDNVFIHKIHRAGYWRALIPSPASVLIGNFVNENEYMPTQPFTKGNDCSLPKLFGMPEQLWVTLNHYRRESAQWWVDSQRVIPNRKENYKGISFDGRVYEDNRPNPVAGLNDIPYWNLYFLSLFGGTESNDVKDIDWEASKTHSQDKWRKEIESDFDR